MVNSGHVERSGVHVFKGSDKPTVIQCTRSRVNSIFSISFSDSIDCSLIKNTVMAHSPLLLLVLAAGFTQVPAWLNRKTDCGVSVWSVWGPTNPQGIRTRTRTVFREPSNGGKGCPPLTQADSDPWVSKTVSEKATQVSTLYGPTIKPRDFLFILDMSGSVDSNEYRLAKDNLAVLVGKICGTIGLGNANNRAAVMTFSTNAVVHFDFDDYTNLADMQNAIRTLPKDSGSTCTGTALVLAERMFTPANGARSDHDSVKEVVLMTDGGSNCGPDAVTAALALRNSRTPELALFVFAIDNFQPDDRLEMETMATPNANGLSDHLFHFISFLEFKQVIDFIVTNVPDTCAPINVGK